ncbi:hypothetical protein ACP3V3_02355 [Vibrio sp. PNB22_3_1]
MVNKSQRLSDYEARLAAAAASGVEVEQNDAEPTAFCTNVSDEENALMDSELSFRKLTKSLAEANLSIEEFLSRHGIDAADAPIFEYELASGDKKTFRLVTVPKGEVESLTTVTFELNGRDQDELRREGVDDLASMAKQQYYAGVGYARSDGLIEVLDGSRRRLSAIILDIDYNILVCDDEISPADARALSKELQTAKEHTILEKGKRWRSIVDSGMSVGELAKIEGVSVATLRRGLTAASVPSGLVKLIPDVSLVTNDQWVALKKLAEKELPKKGKSVSEYVEEVQGSAEYEQLVSTGDVDQKGLVALVLTKIKSRTKRTPTETIKVVSYSDKYKCLKVTRSGGACRIDLGRVGVEEYDAIIKAVREARSSFCDEVED